MSILLKDWAGDTLEPTDTTLGFQAGRVDLRSFNWLVMEINKAINEAGALQTLPQQATDVEAMAGVSTDTFITPAQLQEYVNTYVNAGATSEVPIVYVDSIAPTMTAVADDLGGFTLTITVTGANPDATGIGYYVADSTYIEAVTFIDGAFTFTKYIADGDVDAVSGGALSAFVTTNGTASSAVVTGVIPELIIVPIYVLSAAPSLLVTQNADGTVDVAMSASNVNTDSLGLAFKSPNGSTVRTTVTFSNGSGSTTYTIPSGDALIINGTWQAYVYNTVYDYASELAYYTTSTLI